MGGLDSFLLGDWGLFQFAVTLCCLYNYENRCTFSKKTECDVNVQCAVIFGETLSSNRSSALTGHLLSVRLTEISCFPMAVLSKPPWILCYGTISVPSHSSLCCSDVLLSKKQWDWDSMAAERVTSTSWQKFSHVVIAPQHMHSRLSLNLGIPILALVRYLPGRVSSAFLETASEFHGTEEDRMELLM